MAEHHPFLFDDPLQNFPQQHEPQVAVHAATADGLDQRLAVDRPKDSRPPGRQRLVPQPVTIRDDSFIERPPGRKARRVVEEVANCRAPQIILRQLGNISFQRIVQSEFAVGDEKRRGRGRYEWLGQ